MIAHILEGTTMTITLAVRIATIFCFCFISIALPIILGILVSSTIRGRTSFRKEGLVTCLISAIALACAMIKLINFAPKSEGWLEILILICPMSAGAMSGMFLGVFLGMIVWKCLGPKINKLLGRKI